MSKETKEVAKLKKASKQFFILTDYISANGGVNNIQRSRIIPLGVMCPYMKVFTSKTGTAKARAKSWANKMKLPLVMVG